MLCKSIVEMSNTYIQESLYTRQKNIAKFYYPVILMFRGKSTPYIFNLFIEVLHWIIQHHTPTLLWHYLDDFLFIFKPSVP